MMTANMWFFLTLLTFPLWSSCAPTRRRNPTEIPPALISNGNCRLRLNELNIYPSGGHQFVELVRICEKDPLKVFDVSMQDGKLKSYYKLAFISHDGYLIGVCNLRGKSRARNGNLVFYTVGGEYYSEGTVDMRIQECAFARIFDRPALPNRFPAGDVTPIGLALVYNPSAAVLDAVSLDINGEEYKKVRIDTALQKKLIENLQDFVVYSTSSPYTSCKYFSEFYVNYNPLSEGMYIIRDWGMTDDGFDYTRSRCQKPSDSKTDAWLPFQPKRYSYAPATPNGPNSCEKAFDFVIEDFQRKRSLPRFDFPGKFSCSVTTEDEAIDSLQTITNPLSYAHKLQEALTRSIERLSKAMQEILPQQMSVPMIVPASQQHIDLTQSNQDSTDEVDLLELMNEQVSNTPVQNNGAPALQTDPITREAFEEQLQKSAPHIWSSCDRFEPKSLISALRSQKNPDIYPENIMHPPVCSWFQYVFATKKFRCKFCRLILEQGLLTETAGSKLVTLMMTSGQGYSNSAWAKTANSKLINEHSSNVIHKIAMDYLSLIDSKKTGEELQNAFERADGPLTLHLNATDNTFKHVFQCIRLDLPFEKYTTSVETVEHFGANLGFLYQNPTGYKTILMSISTTMHNELVTLLLTKQPVLSVMLDTSTDISSMATLAIVFHVFGEKGEVEVVLYRIIKVTKGETGEALFELFMTALRDDGLEKYVKEKCVGFSTDGGPNVIKFRKIFNEYTDHQLASIHCMNHRLELAIKKAWKEIPEMVQIEELVNMVYGLFHRSAKKKIILGEAASAAGQKEFSLKRLIKTRWMASRARAITSIFEHWKPLTVALSEIERDKSFQVDQRVKAAIAHQMLQDPHMLSTLAFTADVCEVIASLSLQMQERGTSVIRKKEKREMLLDTLKRLELENGPRLESLLTGTVVGPVSTKGATLQDLEEETVYYEGVQLISTGDMYFGKLSVKRVEYLQPVMLQIDAYYPEDITDKFDILDPTLWGAASLDTYGDEDLKRLNEALLWNYEAKALLAGWKTLKNSIYSHKDFQIQKKQTPEDFWQYYLLDASVKWSDDTKAIVKMILTVQSSTAEVERIYSMYTHTKTPQRYSLEVCTVEAIVRVKFNGPKSLKDFKARRYVLQFLRTHLRADDETRRRKTTQERPFPDDDDTSPPSKCSRTELVADNLDEEGSWETDYSVEDDEEASPLFELL